MKKNICSVKGCTNEIDSKGLCINHYMRKRNHGTTDLLREQHGMKNTSEYRTWTLMKRRCHIKESGDYHLYGAKGISVCERWKQSFTAFYEDMGSKPSPNHQIDRIDGSLGYYKENCRWVLPRINSRNRAFVKMTYEKAEEVRSLNKKTNHRELSALYGVSLATIRDIIYKRTWTVE